MKKLTPRLDLLVALSSATIGCCGLMYVGGIYSRDTFIYKTKDEGYDITNTLRKRVPIVESHRGQPLTRLGIVVASFTFCLSSWLAARRLEPDISFEEFKQTNARERAQHHESLKSENAIHMMNMDSQLARAAADFRTRMQIAAMRIQDGSDFNEMAEQELENQMFAEETPRAEATTPPPSERPPVTPLDITLEDDISTLSQRIHTAIAAYQQQQGFTPLFTETTKEERVEIARSLHRREFSQSEIIYLCWGVSREDATYQDGCTMLERMLGEPPHSDRVELSERAQRLYAYLQKRNISHPEKAISAEKVRVSKIWEGIGTAEVRDLFVELRQAGLANIDDEGKIYLIENT